MSNLHVKETKGRPFEFFGNSWWLYGGPVWLMGDNFSPGSLRDVLRHTACKERFSNFAGDDGTTFKLYGCPAGIAFTEAYGNERGAWLNVGYGNWLFVEGEYVWLGISIDLAFINWEQKRQRRLPINPYDDPTFYRISEEYQ